MSLSEFDKHWMKNCFHLVDMKDGTKDGKRAMLARPVPLEVVLATS